jgi:hypothetical protein
LFKDKQSTQYTHDDANNEAESISTCLSQLLLRDFDLRCFALSEVERFFIGVEF